MENYFRMISYLKIYILNITLAHLKKIPRMGKIFRIWHWNLVRRTFFVFPKFNSNSYEVIHVRFLLTNKYRLSLRNNTNCTIIFQIQMPSQSDDGGQIRAFIICGQLKKWRRMKQNLKL